MFQDVRIDMAVLTDTELQAALRVSRTTLWRLRRTAGLPFFKVGAQFRYRSEDVERWLDQTRYGDIQLPLAFETTTRPARGKAGKGAKK